MLSFVLISPSYIHRLFQAILRECRAKAQEVYDKWREHSEEDVQVFGPNGEIYLCFSRLDIILKRLQSPPPFTTIQEALVERIKLGACSQSRVKEETRLPYNTSDLRASAKPDYVKDAPDDPAEYDMWLHVHRDITDVVRRMPGALKEAKIDPRHAIASILLWDFVPLDKPDSRGTFSAREAGRNPPTTPSRPRTDGASHAHHGIGNAMDWSKVVNALASTTTSPGSARSTCRELPTPPSCTTPPAVNIALDSQTFFPIMDTCVALGCEDPNMMNINDVDMMDAPMTPVEAGFGYGRDYHYA